MARMIIALLLGGLLSLGIIAHRQSAAKKEALKEAAAAPSARSDAVSMLPGMSAAKPGTAATVPEVVRLVGVVVRGRRINAVLSDGRTLTERDGAWDPETGEMKPHSLLIRRVERNFIELRDGTVYYMGVRPATNGSNALAANSGGSASSHVPDVRVGPEIGSRLERDPEGKKSVAVAPPFLGAIEREARSRMTDSIHGEMAR